MNNSTPPPIPNDPFRLSVTTRPQWFPMFFLVGLIGVERGIYYGVRALIVLFLVDFIGVDYGMGYLKYALAGVLGFATMIPGGFISDYLVPRKWALPMSFALEGIGAILIALQNETMIWLGWSFLLVGSGLMRPSSWAYLGELMPGDRSRRMGSFFLALVGVNIFAMLAPLIGGMFEGYAGGIRFFGIVGLAMAMISAVMAITNVLPEIKGREEAKSPVKILLGLLAIVAMGLVGYFILAAESPWADLLKNLGGLGTLVLCGLAFLLIALQKGRKMSDNLGLGLLVGISLLFWLGYEVTASSKFSFIYDSKPEYLEVNQLMMINPLLNVVLGILACVLLFFVLSGKGKIKSLSGVILIGSGVAVLGSAILAFALNVGGGFGLILVMMLVEIAAEALVTPLVLGLSWEFGSGKFRATGMGMVMGSFGVVSLISGWIMSMNEIGLMDTQNPVLQSILGVAIALLTTVVAGVLYFTREK